MIVAILSWLNLSAFATPIFYPEMLVGNVSYGILSRQDLELDPEAMYFFEPVVPLKLESGFGSNSIHWVCGETRALKMECDGPYDDGMSVGSMDLRIGEVWHAFLNGRGLPYKDCVANLRNFKKLVRHQRQVCLRGRFPDVITQAGPLSHWEVWWIWSAIKTKTGQIEW